MIRLLHVEDNADFARAFSNYVDDDVAVRRVASLAELRAFVSASDTTFDGVLVDLRLPDATGRQALDAVSEVLPDTPTFILSGYLEELEDEDLQGMAAAAKDQVLAVRPWLDALRRGTAPDPQQPTPSAVGVVSEDTGPHVVLALPDAYEQRISRLEDGLAEVSEGLSEYHDTASEIRGATRLAKWLAGGVGSVLVAIGVTVAGFLWSANERLGEVEHGVLDVAGDLESHSAEGGPAGHPASVIHRTTVNEGRIRAIENAIEVAAQRDARIQDKLEEILERLPRRHR